MVSKNTLPATDDGFVVPVVKSIYVVCDIVFAVTPLLATKPPVNVPPLNGRNAPDVDELPVYADKLIVNDEYWSVLFWVSVIVFAVNVKPVTKVSAVTGRLRYVVAENVLAVKPLVKFVGPFTVPPVNVDEGKLR